MNKLEKTNKQSDTLEVVRNSRWKRHQKQFQESPRNVNRQKHNYGTLWNIKNKLGTRKKERVRLCWLWKSKFDYSIKCFEISNLLKKLYQSLISLEKNTNQYFFLKTIDLKSLFTIEIKRSKYRKKINSAFSCSEEGIKFS